MLRVLCPILYISNTFLYFLFLILATLVKLCFSMLKCPRVGEGMYLMAAFEERCFVKGGRHLRYIYLLTIPQFLLYVCGLPLAAFLIIYRTDPHRLEHSPNMKLRYGLLYMGYKEDRLWWEVIIALRKVCVVAIGTFGTLLQVVDLQAFLSLAIVFISIIVHLIGKPYDTEDIKNGGRLLHNLEFVALIVAWCTFWGGLIFFLGPKVINSSVAVIMTVLIVMANISFFLVAVYHFAKAFRKESKEKNKDKHRKTEAQSKNSHVVPVRNEAVQKVADNEEEAAEEDETTLNIRDSQLLTRTISTSHPLHTEMHRQAEVKQKAQELHDEFESHENALQEKTNKRQIRQRRITRKFRLSCFVNFIHASHIITIFFFTPFFFRTTCASSIKNKTKQIYV